MPGPKLDKPIPDQIIAHLRALAAAIFSAADGQRWDETKKLLAEFDGVVRKVPFNGKHREVVEELLANVENATRLAVERRDEIGRLINALGK